MKTKSKNTAPSLSPISPNIFAADLQRSVQWLGGVNYENLQKTLLEIKTLMLQAPGEEIHLFVNSFGGGAGIGLSFYDSVRSWLKPNLTTIGSGDVDSSGVMIFLSGKKRYLTKNTTLLFHLAGRTFDHSKRFSTMDMENMLKEDKMKDYQYACVVSDATGGRHTPEKVLDLMARNTILNAEEALNMGLAHRILE